MSKIKLVCAFGSAVVALGIRGAYATGPLAPTATPSTPTKPGAVQPAPAATLPSPSIKGIAIGDPIDAVKRKMPMSCSEKPPSEGQRQVAGWLYCSLSKLPTVGGFPASRFSLISQDGRVQQIIVNAKWEAPRKLSFDEREKAFKEDKTAWLEAIRAQFADGVLNERYVKDRRNGSFHSLRWAYPHANVELSVPTLNLSSISMTLQGASFTPTGLTAQEVAEREAARQKPAKSFAGVLRDMK